MTTKNDVLREPDPDHPKGRRRRKAWTETDVALPLTREQDELPNAQRAWAWIREMAANIPFPCHVETQPAPRFNAPGGAILLWERGRLVATALLVRDDANYSILVRTLHPRPRPLPEDEEPLVG